MSQHIVIVGAGLAGSEAALQLADRGYKITLLEMRPLHQTEVHTGGNAAELVCSNSFKSTKKTSAAGILKAELQALGSKLYSIALDTQVPAGGALAVERDRFSSQVNAALEEYPNIERIAARAEWINAQGHLAYSTAQEELHVIKEYDALILATGPLTSLEFAESLQALTHKENLSFFDAAAPIVMADSLNREVLFAQSRYSDTQTDYLNAPFTKEEYEHFIEELTGAKRVIAKDFETKELFSACQPIEEIARKGLDAPRFGPLKPVGLTNPKTGKRPWAAVQLRQEDKYGSAYNLVGFQTNLSFPEQARVFRLIPGLENAEFARFGVMHKNIFLHAPSVLTPCLRLKEELLDEHAPPIYVAGQLSGTEGYMEAVMSGLYCALAIAASNYEGDVSYPLLDERSVFGALIAYATDEHCKDYQPMHVNFGIMPPLERRIKNKEERYQVYADRARASLEETLRRVAPFWNVRMATHEIRRG